MYPLKLVTGEDQRSDWISQTKKVVLVHGKDKAKWQCFPIWNVSHKEELWLEQ